MGEAASGEPGVVRASGWSRFWRGVWHFILWLVRLIIAIGGGVLLGAAIFYIAFVGVPQFYSQVLNPIQVNTTKLDQRRCYSLTVLNMVVTKLNTSLPAFNSFIFFRPLISKKTPEVFHFRRFDVLQSQFRNKLGSKVASSSLYV